MFVPQTYVHWMLGYLIEFGTLMKLFAKAKSMAVTDGSENSVLSKDGKQRAGWKNQLLFKCFPMPAENG